MKKNLTRVLALAMALLMCLSLLPVSALAGDFDPSAIFAAADAAQAAMMGAPDVSQPEPIYYMAEDAQSPGGAMPNMMDPSLDPNVCLASEDGQHLWIEVHDPVYICGEYGDCNEENPHILYKSCAYCKQSAQWLYEAAMAEVQAEVMTMSDEERAALTDDPALLADLEYRYKQYIFELPDHFYVKQDGLAPTCTTGGYTAYEQCSVCDEIRGYEELGPLGHEWGDYTVSVEPTCTAAGTKMRECLRCGEKEYVDIPALGHDWSEFVTVKEPTCTETGTTRRVCERCGAEDFGEIPANGHSYGDFTILKEATCYEDGSQEHTCTVCDYTETVVIPAAHTWGDFTVTKEPTCTEAGEKEHTCLVCEYVETETIPATGVHTWDNGVCSDCGLACEHSFGEDNICTVCGAEKPADGEIKDEEPAIEEPVVGEPVVGEPVVDEPVVDEPEEEEPKEEEPKEEEPKEEEPKEEEPKEEEPKEEEPKEEEPKEEEPKEEEPKEEEPKEEEPKEEEPKEEEPKEEPVGAMIALEHGDFYASFGSYLNTQGVADASFVVASYTPTDANGQALGEIPAGGVRFELPLPEGADAASVQIYSYSFDTYTWTPANFILSDGQAAVSSGAYPYPPFAVLAAPAASGNGGEGETTPTRQEASSEETVNEFKNLMNEKGISDGSGEIVAQHVTPLREDGTEMPNEEVAERGGVYFEMDLPEGYEEGDTLNIGHRNSETGEWEIITDYEIKGDKVIIHVTHFSDIVIENVKKNDLILEDNPMLGAPDFTVTITGASSNLGNDIALLNQTLTATRSTEDAGDVFEWFTDGTSTSVNTPTYKIQDADLGKAITCKVSRGTEVVDSNTIYAREQIAFNVNIEGKGTVTISQEDASVSTLSIPNQTALNTSDSPNTTTIYTSVGNKVNFVFSPDAGISGYVSYTGFVNGSATPLNNQTALATWNGQTLAVYFGEKGVSRITSVNIYESSDPSTTISEVTINSSGPATVLKAIAAPTGLDYRYSWYRMDKDKNILAYLNTDLTQDTYTLTTADVPYYINCSVYELPNPDGAKSAPNSVHVRLAVPFPTMVRGESHGTVQTRNYNTPHDSSLSNPVIINFPYSTSANPFSIDALTENKVEILATPNSDYMLRYIMEDTSVKVPASKEAQTYTINSVDKSQEKHTITVYFDKPQVVVDAEKALLPSDLQSGNNPNIKKSFQDAYVKSLEDKTEGNYWAYYYVTPCWTGDPAIPISDKDLPAVGPFTFQMKLPTQVTNATYSSFEVHVYHYDKTAEKWEEVTGFELVPGEDKIEIKDFTKFSPFGIVALPSYTVKYAADPNPAAAGGTISNADDSGVKGTVIKLPEPEFTTNPGYTFAGWQIEGETELRDPGYEITLSKSITVTAKWEEGYTITLNPNDAGNPDTYGALVEGEMPPIYVKKGNSVTISNKYSLTNHEFKGWSKTGGAGNTEDPTYSSAFIPDSNLVLYAVWNRTHVTIAYNSNGGNGSMDNQQAKLGSSITLTKNSFTHPTESKMFAGWSKDAPTGNIDFTDSQTIDVNTDLGKKDTTLYAVWRDKVTITFYPDSESGKGGGTMTPQIVPSGADSTLKKNAFTAPSSGVAFAGWNEKKDGGGISYVDQDIVNFTGDVPLYAQWGPAITITYNKNSDDASGIMAAQKVAANESFKLDELSFTNPSAKFVGWAKSSTGTKEFDDGATVPAPGFSENTTLYAIWDKHAFTGTVRITGSYSGSADKAVVGEVLTANVTGESEFTDFKYQWLKNGVEIPGATKQTYEPTTADAGQTLSCQVWAEDSPDKNKKTSINSKTVGIEDSKEKIVNNGELQRAYVYGVYPEMFCTLNNVDVGPVGTEGVAELTQQGVYRFYTGPDKKTLLGTVEVTNWYTVGYVNSTSTSTASTSSTTSTSGSGTITAKATYDGSERTLTTSTKITDPVTGETVLEPYSVPGYSNSWIVKQDSGVGFYLTVRPASGSYGHVSLNNGGYDSSSAERTYRVDPVNTYAMYSIIFNRSSSSPRTADDSHLGLWSALCFMSLAGATVLLNGQRKRRKARR